MRSFIATLFRFGALLFVFGGLLEQSTATAARPNVLFIVIDDLNDWIGCLGGHPQALTPNIDKLASRGVLFTNAHCASPACNPSRAAVFSGQRPHRTGVWSNRTGRLNRLQPKLQQIPTSFAKAGYHTLGTGKLTHGGAFKFETTFKTEQRWSPFSKQAVLYTKAELPTKGTNNPRHVLQDSLGREVILPLNRMPSDRAPEKMSGESFDWGPFDVPDSDFGDTRMTSWSIEKLQAGCDKPFLLGVGYYRPHIPLFAPKRFFDRFKEHPGILPPFKDDDLNDLGEAGRKWALEADTAGLHATVVKHKQWRPAVEAYLACVTYVDHEVGRLLEAFDRSSAANNTVIVLWSDHGWQLGEKQHWGKWTGWERSTKVPLIIVPPKSQAAMFATPGSRCSQPVSLIDIYPTLQEFCDLDVPHELDGQSLIPLLRQPTKKTDRHVLTMFNPGNVSVRNNRFRYIRYADGSEELYDIQADPNEWTNLASDDRFTSRLKSLRQEIPQDVVKSYSRQSQ